MKILVDMDDVMEDLLGTWTEFLNTKYGLKVKREDVKEWDMQVAYPTLSKEEIYSPLSNEDMWAEVKPIPNAVSFIKRLMEEHDVFVLTASHYNNVKVKMENVLVKYFPFISYDNVIVASKKQMVLGDVLIDDNPNNLIGGTYKGILFDAPHNQTFNEHDYNIVRVENWEEIYNTISELKGDKLYLNNQERGCDK